MREETGKMSKENTDKTTHSKERKKYAFELIAKGLETKEIADAVGLKVCTIKGYKSQYRKLHGIRPEKKKTAREQVFEMADQGMHAGEIIEKTGYASGTIYAYMSEWRKEQREAADRTDGETYPERDAGRTSKGRIRKAGKPVENADGTWCKFCRYGTGTNDRWHLCNYICITGHSRGCPSSLCDKFIPGKPEKKKGVIT